jgi:hypothetical protein
VTGDAKPKNEQPKLIISLLESTGLSSYLTSEYAPRQNQSLILVKMGSPFALKFKREGARITLESHDHQPIGIAGEQIEWIKKRWALHDCRESTTSGRPVSAKAQPESDTACHTALEFFESSDGVSDGTTCEMVTLSPGRVGNHVYFSGGRSARNLSAPALIKEWCWNPEGGIQSQKETETPLVTTPLGTISPKGDPSLVLGMLTNLASEDKSEEKMDEDDKVILNACTTFDRNTFLAPFLSPADEWLAER